MHCKSQLKPSIPRKIDYCKDSAVAQHHVLATDRQVHFEETKQTHQMKRVNTKLT